MRRSSLRIEKPQPLVAGAKVANRARWGEPIQAECSAGVNATPNRRSHHASRPTIARRRNGFRSFIFFSSAVVLDRGGELSDAVLSPIAIAVSIAIAIAEGLRHRQRFIFFTGGPGIGEIIHQAAAKNRKPCVLELGGKNTTIGFRL